uniref:Response regulatory domain-containing protein n=1 Tax=Gossypium raimondii TaxID=29730 RepID=A0A0D2PE94_GOSRA|nr:hypothetical protein B456_007G240900 [Gossypium raimondii]
MSTASLLTTWKVRDVVPVPDQFPTSLRVLVVDDDPTCLRFLEKMLRNCSYDVTKCNRVKTALSKLRENRNGFDIITSDVYMPDMDGFKLLEHIGLDIDLPIIKVVMKGVRHGACDYLIKPVRIEALKNIWKLEKLEKRKDNKDESEDKDDTSTLKTPWVVWSVELHQQFVPAVNQLGIDSTILLPKYVGLAHEDAREHLKSFLLICASFSQKGCNIPK